MPTTDPFWTTAGQSFAGLVAVVAPAIVSARKTAKALKASEDKRSVEAASKVREELEAANKTVHDELASANARALEFRAQRDAAEAECKAERARANLLQDALDESTVEARPLKQWSRVAYADLLERDPSYPKPPIPAPRPDPITAQRSKDSEKP